MSEKQNSPQTRREFIRTAALTVAAGTVASSMPTTAEGMRRVIGANDRIHVGHVGIGVQGGYHLRSVKENGSANLNNNTEQIAVCDIYTRAKKEAQKQVGLNDNQTFDDYRKMMEVKEIDAVFVTTADNWHAPVALAALDAGKHVYCEKPMCKTLEENFALYDKVKSTKKIFQVGSQGCSTPIYAAIAKHIKAGKIGTMIVGQHSYNRGDNKVGEWNSYRRIDPDASPTASGDGYVNWDVFRKGTEPKEWDPDRYFRWRKYWEYGSGVVGDLLPHRLHPLFIAMGLPTTGLDGFPMRVASLGGLYVQKINPENGKPDREVPDFINLMVDFGDCSMMLMSSTITEEGWTPTIRGNKAVLKFNGGKIQIQPEPNFTDVVEASTEDSDDGEHTELHEKNFFDSIRTNTPPNCPIDLAVRVQTIISMGEMSFRQGKMIHFDPKTRKASDSAPMDQATKIALAKR